MKLSELTVMGKVKVALWVILALIAALLAILNRKTVDVHLIAGTFSTSLALLIVGVLAVGFLLGWVGHSFELRRRRKK